MRLVTKTLENIFTLLCIGSLSSNVIYEYIFDFD